jgi:hypothetical protein
MSEITFQEDFFIDKDEPGYKSRYFSVQVQDNKSDDLEIELAIECDGRRNTLRCSREEFKKLLLLVDKGTKAVNAGRTASNK